MEIKGKIIHVLESRTGESSKGPWTVQNFVLQETKGDYPKTISFEAFNKDWQLKEGQEVVVSINVESREYQGKWYPSIKAWKFEPLNGVVNSSTEIPPAPTDGAPELDDLAF